MNETRTTERILDAFLAPDADRLADRVVDAALDEIARIPQRRALRVPWRLPFMPVLTRTTGIAAVALVAVIGAGGLLLLNSRAPGVGSQLTPTPQPTATPAPTQKTPGITGWTSYTSVVHGYGMKYPTDWGVEAPATRTWQTSDGVPLDPSAPDPGWPWADVFTTKAEGDASIALFVWEVPGGGATDLETIHGLKAWVTAYCKAAPGMFEGRDCETYPQDAIPMCLNAGGDPCRGAILVSDADSVFAYFEDWSSAMLTESPNVRVAWVARPDAFPGAARYGGSISLLQSILTTMDVFIPTSGQVPPA